VRDKELRLALICYGGISLAVYMHGVTKEIWNATRASARVDTASPAVSGYRALLDHIAAKAQIGVRIIPDIIAGASAGGINGVFLAQAIATGQTLEPLTRMWLDNADIDQLLDPGARPESGFTKFWATPIAHLLLRRSKADITESVGSEARFEVGEKLKRFVRARWFEPPFGGPGFTNMLLDAFAAMAKEPAGPRLLPGRQPLDLFVTVTDFHGHPTRLRLNSPSESFENEHRITLAFGQRNDLASLADPAELTLAARATASFPGAFPPFSVGELDGVLKARNQEWKSRDAFLARIMPGNPKPEQTMLIDGSVLANAPFRPAIEALRERPARREVDRRFVYIDPKPGIRSVRLTKSSDDHLPGFFSTIFGAMSDIPREQPIRDNLEAIDLRSARIRRMQHIIESVRPGVEATIEALFGRTFFLDNPTTARVQTWRRKAQVGAARDAGYAFAAYGHVKLSGIVEEMAALAARHNPALVDQAFDDFRRQLWDEVRSRGADQVWQASGKGASDAAISFFRAHDLGFRVRRMRFVIRTLQQMQNEGRMAEAVAQPLRMAFYALLSPFLDREGFGFYQGLGASDAVPVMDSVAAQRDLVVLDEATDAGMATALANCPKAERRALMFAYLGFPYFDISTLPMLQGEGLDEFDPIKVDRISPEDAVSIRKGGARATLKGIEFNSFGAFFSRAYRENDYLWGRLHGADRLFDIICSAVPGFDPLGDAELRRLKREILLAILAEEEGRLTRIPALFAEIRRELAAGPLSG
jgi:patatin-related protein